MFSGVGEFITEMIKREIHKVIVTGATGAIGMALIEEMISHNIEILVICIEGSERNKQIPDHRLLTKVESSLENLQFLQNSFDEKYDAFFHFAWNGTTGASRNDMFLQNENVRFALDAVEVAKRFGCKMFIGAGSQAEYGSVMGECKLSANTPCFPKTGYGIAKLCAGQMTRERAHQLGMEHVWTRILSVYGPYDGMQSMVMSGIGKMVHGEHAGYTKGEQMWDYLYSKDAAKAFLSIAEHGQDSSVYSLGSGQVRSLRSYIEEIRDAVNESTDIVFGEVPYYENQVMYLCADISELIKDVGFIPQYSFEHGIRETVDWYRKHS